MSYKESSFTEKHGTCSRCKETKAIEHFAKNKKAINGRYSVCKACERIRARLNYEKRLKKLY